MRGRTVKPGISFYRMDSGHIAHDKVRLLYNEFGSDGYYIWCCILDKAYAKWGYYFDTNNKEELELFASEYCKKKLTTINEVIAGCVRRDLFDKAVFDSFGILTCDKMQETYIIATAERRQKGSIFEIQEDWLLLDLSADVPPNIRIIPGKKSFLPPKKSIVPPNNSQNREDKNRVDKSIEEKNSAPAKPTPPKAVSKGKEENAEPYWQDLVNTWFAFHVENKLDEPSFAGKDPRTFKQLVQLLKKRATRKNQEWTLENSCGALKYFLTLAFAENWLKEHFSLDNLVSQFDAVYHRANLKNQKAAPAATANTAPKSFKETMNYLFGRYMENELDVRLIQPDYYDTLVVRDVIAHGTADMMPGETIEEKKQQAVLAFFEALKQKQHGSVHTAATA